jgi:hypothetical protein
VFKNRVLFLSVLIISHFTKVPAQLSKDHEPAPADSTTVKGGQKKYADVDLVDVGRYFLIRRAKPRNDTGNIKTGKLHASVLPAVQYTLQTGFAVSAVSNFAFYTSNQPDANISSVLMSVNYTQKKQFFVPIQGNFWTKGNKVNILTDWHFEKFPQSTYGLGGHTTVANSYTIDYTYIRMYQTFLKTIAPDLYTGLGYNLDYYWHIKEVDPPAGIVTDFGQYGLTSRSIASGITLNLLYDTRRNSINPQPGYYANLVLRNNFTFLGSDANWQSLLIDARKYIHFPSTSKNTWAFWTYAWFNISGKAPYLSLASTASDTYLNFGRGYIQGRFRGQNLLYLESEYRFGITHNGLVGGVVFVNGQSFTEPVSKHFEVVLPGYGMGVRFKLNKFSRTSIALDYGWGAHGSQGIFANLGEVF